MKNSISCVAFVAVFAIICLAQEQGGNAPAERVTPRLTDSNAAVAAPPRLMKFSGIVKSADGKPRTGRVAMRFSIYAQEQGASALWTESQNVDADEQGQYTVLLGAASPDGVPLDLFVQNEQRWLGVALADPGAEEQPRTLLVSVPYALKAADAETLGGKPLSAFVLASGEHSPLLAPASSTAESGNARGVAIGPAPRNEPTNNHLVLWNGGYIDSNAHQLNGNIGIGTDNPQKPLDVWGDMRANTTAGQTNLWLRNDSSGGNEWYVASVGANGTGDQVGSLEFWDNSQGGMVLHLGNNGNVGIRTAAPAGKLDIYQPITTADFVYTLLTAGYGGLVNRNVVLQQIGNAVTSNQFLFLNGNLGAASTTGFPKVTSQYAYTFGLEGNDINLNLITAPPGTNVTPTRALSVYYNGNVGIGRTDPVQKLDVVGNISASGDLMPAGITFPDGTRQTTACGSIAFGEGNEVKVMGASGGLHAAANVSAESILALIREQQAQIAELRAQIAALKQRLGDK